MAEVTRRALIAAGIVIPALTLMVLPTSAQTPPPAAAPAPAAPASGSATPAPKDAYLYIIWPSNNERIKGAFWCRFGLRNMGIARAGDHHENSGHHHLFIDVNEDLKPGDVIPADKNHVHFGAGQSEARLDLPPGKHTLQLVLGDADHKVFDPPVVSKKITIFVR
jgi:hypothetical protein